jgi:hypothetical protein
MAERYVPEPGKISRFKPGTRPENSGRKKGKPNKTTKLVKDAISGACEKLGMLKPIWAYKNDYEKQGNRTVKIKVKDRIIGWEPTGEGGAEGYMIWLGCNHPQAFATLVGRMIPLQVNASGTMDMTITQKFSDVQIEKMTLAEKLAAMRDMISMTKALPDDSATNSRMIEGKAERVPAEANG